MYRIFSYVRSFGSGILPKNNRSVVRKNKAPAHYLVLWTSNACKNLFSLLALDNTHALDSPIVRAVMHMLMIIKKWPNSQLLARQIY